MNDPRPVALDAGAGDGGVEGGATFDVGIDAGPDDSGRDGPPDDPDAGPPPPPPLRIVTRVLPPATRGAHYSAQVEAAGGVGTTRVWSLGTGAPEWVSLDGRGSEVTVSGSVPATGGTMNVSLPLRVSDEAGAMASATVVFALRRTASSLELVVDAPTSGYELGPFQAIARASGGAGDYNYTFARGALPMGLVLDDVTGVLAGTLPAGSSRAMPYEMVMQVTDGAGDTALALLTFEVRPPSDATWRRLNGGQPLLEITGSDNYIGSVEMLKTANGELLWMASTWRQGTIMGRLDAEDHWQVFREGAFHDELGAGPSAISPSFSTFHTMNAFADPRRPDGFVMLVNQRLRFGTSQLDIHGFPSFHRFDGHEREAWGSGAAYDPYVAGPVVYGWNGTGNDGTAFAYDAAHDEGLAVGTTGFRLAGFLDHLVATRYDGADAAQSWRRWSRAYDREGGDPGRWHDDNRWEDVNDQAASRRELILDPRIDLGRYSFNRPRVTHLLGTRNYLVTFLMWDRMEGTAPPVAGAALYEHGSETPWSYWGAGSFRPVAAETSSFAEAISSLAADGAAAFEIRPFALPGGDAIVMIANEREARLDARRYYASTRSFGPVETLMGSHAEGGVTGEAGLIGDGTLLAAFSVDGRGVVARALRPDGTWTPAETVFVGDGVSQVVDVTEVDGRPVVLIRDGGRLFAVSRYVGRDWAAQRPLVVREPAIVSVDAPPGLVIDSQALNTATDADYGAAPPGQLALDQGGYAYATRTTVCSTIIHSPGSTAPDTNRSWGAFFDIVAFPAGVAIDSVRGRVFVSSEIIQEAAGGVGRLGAISIWENVPYRDRNIGRRGFTGPLPASYSRGFVPRFVRPGVRFPSSIAIDSARGVLYVTSSLTHEIYALDIAHIETRPLALSTSSFEENVGGYAREVRAVVDALVEEGIMSNVSAGYVAFVAGLTRFGSVEELVRRVPAFASLPTRSADELLRNLSNAFQYVLSDPPVLFRWGSYGTGPSQLRFPMGLALDEAGDLYVVDSDNHRALRLHVDLEARTFTPVLSFGHLGTGDGGLLHPVGIAVTEDGRVWIADPRNQQLVVFRGDGAFDFRFTDADRGTPSLPADGMAIVAGSDGRLVFGSGRNVVHATWRAP